MGARGAAKTGGRKPGSVSKRLSRLPDAQAIAERLGINPLEILLNFAANNWQALGYQSPTKIIVTQAGREILVDTIAPDERIASAKAATEYLYSKRQSVAITDNAGNNVFETFNDWVKTLVPKP